MSLRVRIHNATRRDSPLYTFPFCGSRFDSLFQFFQRDTQNIANNSHSVKSLKSTSISASKDLTATSDTGSLLTGRLDRAGVNHRIQQMLHDGKDVFPRTEQFAWRRHQASRRNCTQKTALEPCGLRVRFPSPILPRTKHFRLRNRTRPRHSRGRVSLAWERTWFGMKHASQHHYSYRKTREPKQARRI